MRRVEVFRMKVTGRFEEWPEKHQRTSRWFPYKVAAEQVAEREFKELIRAFGVTTSKTLSKRRGKEKKAARKAA
jgi:hypothetical protein